MPTALCAVFFVSGFASLVFETLWFRQSGLVFGNTVWASSITTASFMGGLALGSGLAARHGGRLRRPLHGYAALEVLVGLVGLALVLEIPSVVELTTPLFRPFLTHGAALNGLRLILAFLLLLVPATAMGATLPILARVLSPLQPDFGRVLGQLYGWNTLGAVAGAVAGEAVLIERLGIRGTGAVAASLDLAAATAALLLGRLVPRDVDVPSLTEQRLTRPAARLLAAAFLSGALLLALEVVWFRFLLLFLEATSLAFAALLAVVLTGLGLGGLVAARWLAWDSDATRWVPRLALLAGVVCAISYAAFTDAMAAFQASLMTSMWDVAGMGARLMLPTCLVSGVLFPLLGKSLRPHVSTETRAAGWLTLFNTAGAAGGAVAAGFLLLPYAGVERSLQGIAWMYSVVALLTARSGDLRRLLGATAVFALGLGLFPAGLMRNYYIPQSVRRWTGDGSRIVASREGLTETIVYLRRDLLGEPFYFRLVTNSISMAGSQAASQRYMGLFAWWPLALHPGAEDALLISFGVGTTARALVESDLRSIDLVDTSADILEMGRLVQPEAYPVDDSRVQVHVEDGRFFLTTTARKYDIITSEPPPPKEVVSLYTQEYFRLLRQHLKPGGLATYWLPVALLEPQDFKGVTRAFCDAFPDCSLWTGYGPEWMLAGSGGAVRAPTEQEMARLWEGSRSGPALRRAALERPEQLGTLFIADATTLAELVGDVPPVTDDRPYRLSPRRTLVNAGFYSSFAGTAASRGRFLQSPLIRAWWPPAMRERTIPFFEAQVILNRLGWASYGSGKVGLAEARELLTATQLRTAVSWTLESGEAEQEIAERRIAERGSGHLIHEHLGIRALAKRDLHDAERHFIAALDAGADKKRLEGLRDLARKQETGLASP